MRKKTAVFKGIQRTPVSAAQSLPTAAMLAQHRPALVMIVSVHSLGVGMTGEEMGHYMLPIGEPDHRQARQRAESELKTPEEATRKLPSPPAIQQSESPPSLPLSSRAGAQDICEVVCSRIEPRALLHFLGTPMGVA